jgi:NAD dependent epimerase/dehydratase family enzyme
VKIIIIGATGTIGAVVASGLKPKHQVTRVSRTGSIKADLNDPSLPYTASMVDLVQSID